MARKNDVTLRLSAESSALQQDLRRSEGMVKRWGANVAGVYRRSTAESSALQQDLRRSEGMVKRRGANVAGVYRRSTAKISSHLESAISSPVMGLLGSAAILAAGKQLIDYDAKLARTAINTGMTATEQSRLAAEISNVAGATHQSRDDILAGVDAISAKKENLGNAIYLMKDIGIAATATGARFEDLSGFSQEMIEKFGLAKEEVADMLNTLNVQGKSGGLKLKDMAELGERLFSVAEGFNVHGKEGIKSFGAFLQMARKGSGNTEDAAITVEKTMNAILEKPGQIKKLTGFDVFSSKKSKDGVRVLKSVDEILKGIIRSTGGDMTKLYKIFGAAPMRAVRPMALEYQKTGKFGEYDAYRNADIGHKTETMRDFSHMSQEAATHVADIANALRNMAALVLGPAITEMKKQMDDIAGDPEKMREYKNALVAISTVLSSMVQIVGESVEGWAKLIDLWGKVSGWVAEQTNTPYDQSGKAEFARMQEQNKQAMGHKLKPVASSIEHVKIPGWLMVVDNWLGKNYPTLRHTSPPSLRPTIDQKITIIAPAGTRVFSESSGSGAQQTTDLRHGSLTR